MQQVSYNQTRHSGDSSSRLERVASLSCKLTAWPDWKFCPVVQQLVWPFSSPLHASHVCHSGNLPVARLPWIAHFWDFFTLFHTLPLYESHLNTRYLIAKLHVNLARNKANKWLNKFNLTLSSLESKINGFLELKPIPSSFCRMQLNIYVAPWEAWINELFLQRGESRFVKLTYQWCLGSSWWGLSRASQWWAFCSRAKATWFPWTSPASYIKPTSLQFQ